jgi:hypothetical protein
MKTFTQPVTRVRLFESGGIKTLSKEVRIKELASTDDTTDVRLVAAGPYRIVMHCKSVGRAHTDNSAITNQ